MPVRGIFFSGLAEKRLKKIIATIQLKELKKYERSCTCALCVQKIVLLSGATTQYIFVWTSHDSTEKRREFPIKLFLKKIKNIYEHYEQSSVKKEFSTLRHRLVETRRL